MKKLSILGIILFSSFSLLCQVAINRDGTPVTDSTAMLEVKKGIKSKVKIRSLDYNDTAQLELSNRRISGEGTDFLITANRQEGLYFSAISNQAVNNNDSILTLKTDGNIGIGKKAPVYKLDVNGDVNLNSSLRINGNAGISGQVLTATSSGAPQWKASSFNNNTRFFVKGMALDAVGLDFAFINTVYNTNAADIVIGSNSITVNKTGLYHFDGSLSVSAEYFPGAAFPPYSILGFNFTTGGNDYYMGIIEDILPAKTSSGNSQWYGVVRTYSLISTLLRVQY